MEQPLSVAFLILAHQDAPMLTLLLNALPRNAYKIVHVDQKSRQFDDFAPVTANTMFIENRLPVYWAGFSVVEATLELIRVAVAQTRAQRLVLLSGQSYPLLSNAAILEFFSAHLHDEFIGYIDVEKAGGIYLEKLQHRFISEEIFAQRFKLKHPKVLKFGSRISTRAARAFRRNWRKRLKDVTPAYGSQWWALTRACALHILEASETESWPRFYKLCFAPDEMYFHTLVANSAFHERAGGFLAFEGRGNWRMNKLHMLNSKGSLHKVFGISDWDDVAASDRMFIRKLTSQGSAELIARIEAEKRLQLAA